MDNRLKFPESECKTAPTRVQGMPFQWSLNPYRGCSHACPYCYARDYFRRMDRDPGAGFDREIEVKTNFAAVLERELRRPRDGAVALAAHEAGAVAFGSRPLKLDPGTKDVFYAFVAAQFPELLPRYIERYGDGTKLDPAFLRTVEARIDRASAGLRFHDEPQRFS